MNELRELLSSPKFRAFALARLISNLGNGMAPVALAFAVLGLDGANATTLSLVLGTQSAVTVVMLPFGGVWADRIGRIRAVAGSDVILGCLLIVQATLFLADAVTVPMLVGIACIVGFLHAMFYPAFPTIAPAVAPADKLQSANSLISGLSAGAGILGGASAGVIVATIGASWALMFDALTFIVAGLLVWTLKDLTFAQEARESTWRQLKTGWHEFYSNRWVFVIVLSFTFMLMAYFGSHNVLGPVIMKQHYAGATSWAVVITAESVGFLAGAALAFRLRPRWPMRTAMVSMFTFVIFVSTLALQAPVYVIAIAGFLAGLGTEVFQTLWITALQRHVPRESLARVSSYDAFGSLLCGPIGLALAGPLSHAWGTVPTLWAAAGLITVAALVALTHRSVWRLADDGAVSDPAAV